MTIRVSVLVPTYNRPRLLREAIASAAMQTMDSADFDVLILNDGEPMAREPEFGRVIDLPHGGLSAALNAGLREAQGEFVTVLPDDDLLYPDALYVLDQALSAAPTTVGAVYSLPQYTDEHGVPTSTPKRLQAYLNAHPRITWEHVARGDGFFVHGIGTMYRREALEDIGGWDVELPTAEEFDLHLRLLHAGWDFHAVDAVTVAYRQHSGGKSQVRQRRRSIRRVHALRRIYSRLGLSAKEVA
jgi:glycosyltransferase involved in cell wall biosynthesis